MNAVELLRQRICPVTNSLRIGIGGQVGVNSPLCPSVRADVIGFVMHFSFPSQQLASGHRGSLYPDAEVNGQPKSKRSTVTAQR
jgi:hypothetical protein